MFKKTLWSKYRTTDANGNIVSQFAIWKQRGKKVYDHVIITL